MGVGGLLGVAAALFCPDYLRLEAHRAGQGSLRCAAGFRHAGDFFLARRYQRRDGHRDHAGGWGAAAVVQLWRLGIGLHDVRDRPDDQRQYAAVYLLKDGVME